MAKSNTPSNARTRRQQHLKRDAEVKARKRLRRERAAEYADAIQRQQQLERDRASDRRMREAAATDAAEMLAGNTVQLQHHGPMYIRPFTVGTKGKDGWPVLNGNGMVYMHVPSRTKARELRDKLNTIGKGE